MLDIHIRSDECDAEAIQTRIKEWNAPLVIRWIDIPPVWLIAFILLAWALSQALPGLTFGFAWQGLIALILFLAGALLMGLAAWEMYRARTTIIPHRQPNALVTSGVFRLSRNPIYLGDMMILLAAIVLWGAILAVPLMWLFKRTIEARFIKPEEGRLYAAFGEGFNDWAKVTRRWV